MNNPTPTQAHDIVNKDINVILMHLKYENCDYCKGRLQGIISMEASEIEFLEEFYQYYKLSKKHVISKRLQALKISMNDLKEKVK